MALNIKPLYPFDHPDPVHDDTIHMGQTSDHRDKEEREEKKDPKDTMPYEIYKEILLGMDPFFRARLKKLP